MSKITKVLSAIERSGNKLPHPTLLFIYLCGIVIFTSWVCSLLGVSVEHPISLETITAKSLLSVEGLHFFLTNAIQNFTGFAPVGSVLVAVMGIGVAEHSGLINTLLKATILKAPKKLTTFFIVTTAVLSSLAADTGYVIIIPLAGIIFHSLGRNPLAGIVAAFAGVSGGFSANLLIGPLDVILGGISTEAAHLVDPNYEVSAAANYYFIVVSTLLIGLVGTLITELIVEPWLPKPDSTAQLDIALSQEEKRGLWSVGVFSLIFIALIALSTVPESGVLRDPETKSILRSPFIQGIVIIIAVYGALSGLIYAKFTNSKNAKNVLVEAMEKHTSTMASYIVLMFFAAQFVNFFGWSQLGGIFAIEGAQMLQAAQLPKELLLVCFILMSATINLFIGSASAKWALIAPIFIPMLLLMGISPEATQMAYRIGDSTTNIITPLMPYFGVVVAFAQQYDKKIGIGTLISVMIPYSLFFLLSWTALLTIWIVFALPLGPGATVFIN